MDDDELHQVRVTRGLNLIHLATAVTSAVPCYNLNGIGRPLNFSAETLSGIFLGRIRNWNDPAIRALNPMAKLPDSEIVVIGHYGEGGSMNAWSDFLSKESREWRRAVGPVRALLKPTVRVRGQKYGRVRNHGVQGVDVRSGDERGLGAVGRRSRRHQ